MASDYRPLSPERELGRGTSPSELDFMYDKATIDQATIFIEDAIKVTATSGFKTRFAPENSLFTSK